MRHLPSRFRHALLPKSGSPLDQSDLLPDLARKARPQQLDIRHRRGDALIWHRLRIKRRQFAGDRQKLAAIVQIARHPHRIQIARGRGFRGLEIRRKRHRILGQLVHVDDMDHRPQPVQPPRHALALDPRLQPDQRDKGQRRKQDRIHRRLDPLNRPDGILPDLAQGQDRPDPKKDRCARQNRQRDQTAQPPDRPAKGGDLAADPSGLSGHLASDTGKAPLWKAFCNPQLQSFAGFKDHQRVKTAERHGLTYHPGRAPKTLSQWPKYPRRRPTSGFRTLRESPREKACAAGAQFENRWHPNGPLVIRAPTASPESPVGHHPALGQGAGTQHPAGWTS